MHRHVKEKMRGDQDDADLDVADQDVGHDLADQHFARARGHGEQIFHRAALALAGDGEAGDHDHRHGENHAHEAGDDVVLRDDLGVVERVDAEIDRAGASALSEASGPLRSLLQRGIEERA